MTRGLEPEASQDEIAIALGVSRARVAQIEVRALDRLRRCFALIEGGVKVDVAVDMCRGKWRPCPKRGPRRGAR